MNAIHLHLALNHFPVVLACFGLLIALPALWLENLFWKRAATLVLFAAACFAVPAFLSGEGAEHYLERLGAAKELIKPHERFGKLAFGAILVCGAVAAVNWLVLLSGSRFIRMTFLALTVAAAFASALLFYAAFEGGKIAHKEIRPGNAAAETVAPSPKRERGD